MLKAEVVKINVATGKISETTDYVAEEKPLQILVNKETCATIFCSPSNQKELAVGHLLSEGIIRSVEEIQSVRIRQERVCNIKTIPTVNLDERLRFRGASSRLFASGFGSPTPHQTSSRLPRIKSELAVEAEVVMSCVKRLDSIAETFRKTGGVHAAAICKRKGQLVAFAEDVGRHNAVDKVVGIGALNHIDFSEVLLASTGRLTGGIVLKAARIRLPIIASLAAALDSGIAVAKSIGLTLIGFAREERMNVYSFPERILS